MAPIDARQGVFAGVLLLANRMQATYDSEMGNLTLKQWLALAVVANLHQPIPSTAVVASALGTTHQNVRKLLTALAEKGYVTLSPSPDDGRARQISLTPAALAFFDQYDVKSTELLNALFDGIHPDDVATCLRVLDALSVSLTGEPLVPDESHH